MSKTFKKTAKIKSKSLQSRIWFGFDCKYKADKAFSSLTRISGWILLESYGLSETDIWINVLICCVEPERLMSTCSVSERWFVNSLHFMLDHFIAKFDRKYKMQSEWQKCNFSKKLIWYQQWNELHCDGSKLFQDVWQLMRNSKRFNYLWNKHWEVILIASKMMLFQG